jgi:hypothetical protein
VAGQKGLEGIFQNSGTELVLGERPTLAFFSGLGIMCLHDARTFSENRML